jgi:hypothetical protein
MMWISRSRQGFPRSVLVAALIGKWGTVVDEIESQGGYGRVKTGGEEWRAIATDPREIALAIHNAGTSVVEVAVRGLAYSTEAARLAVDAGAQSAHVWSAEDSDGWYDIEVTVDGDPSFRRRLTGHIENGKPSVTG